MKSAIIASTIVGVFAEKPKASIEGHHQNCKLGDSEYCSHHIYNHDHKWGVDGIYKCADFKTDSNEADVYRISEAFVWGSVSADDPKDNMANCASKNTFLKDAKIKEAKNNFLDAYGKLNEQMILTVIDPEENDACKQYRSVNMLPCIKAWSANPPKTTDEMVSGITVV